ncbi:MAG: hypothetical protein PHV59_03335 [Victivallales bacterium]|nr:hypothetical protein [Victivallales bacterium]
MVALNLSFSFWDWALIVIVSCQASLLAYLHRPALKALLVTLPIPFTLAFISLGCDVDVTNVLGLLVLLLYAYCVRFLYITRKWNIIAAIAVSALGYCVTGSLLTAFVSRTETAFWTGAVLIYAVALYLYLKHFAEEEQGHKSSLPVIAKLLIIAGVIAFIVLIKKFLHGFMTFFPMVGVVASYEMRHCLNTFCRQMPIVILTMMPMLITIRIFQKSAGIYVALGLGWLVFSGFLAITYTSMTSAPSAAIFLA